MIVLTLLVCFGVTQKLRICQFAHLLFEPHHCRFVLRFIFLAVCGIVLNSLRPTVASKCSVGSLNQTVRNSIAWIEVDAEHLPCRMLVSAHADTRAEVYWVQRNNSCALAKMGMAIARRKAVNHVKGRKIRWYQISFVQNDLQ